MKRLLVITLLEYKSRPNNRVHHTVRSLSREFEEVYLLFRSEPDRRTRGTKLKNLFPRIAPLQRKDNLFMIEFNPPLNWVERYDFSHGPGRKEDKKRRVIRTFSNLFGLWREFSFIVFIFLVCLIRLRGKVFDVCLIETSWEGIPARILRKMGWIRFLVFDDNDFGPGYMQNVLRRKWELFLEKSCIRSSDLVVSASYNLAELWKEEAGRDVIVIPNGVDLELFRGRIKKVNRESPKLVYVGNLSSSWMDFRGVFEAISLLVEGHEGLLFLIIGDEGESRFRELKRDVDDLGISEHVRFLGRISHRDLPRTLSECDIGLALAPSNLLRKYAFPLKVVEYMALGLPVLATKGTEAEHTVSEHRCGLCVGPEVGEVRSAIQTLIEDEDLFRECSENGLKGVVGFGIDRLARIRIEEIKKGYRRKTARNGGNKMGG